MDDIGVIFLCFIVFAFFIGILYAIFASPFKYPYFILDIDVSGKRHPNIEKLIDNYLIEHGFAEFETHMQKVCRWKEESLARVERSRLRGYRFNQFQESLDDQHEFQFRTTREHTRYRQRNYVRTSYKVHDLDSVWSCSYQDLKYRYEQLKAINFEATLADYHSKNQRTLMTRELRRQIMQRDNYTCKNCGKYMPDEVGLQVDHIIPVAKGGKTVPSNLQVLCSKCNGRKHDKL